MDSQYKLLSELLSDQAAFITSPKTSLANYWGALPPCPPVSTGLLNENIGLKNCKGGKKPSQIYFARGLHGRGVCMGAGYSPHLRERPGDGGELTTLPHIAGLIQSCKIRGKEMLRKVKENI